jgi:periplasmic protein CpxP/Spy
MGEPASPATNRQEPFAMEDLDKLASQPAAAQRPERKPRRAGLFIVLAALGAAIAGGLATHAFANDMGRWWGGGWGMHGWGMHGGRGMDDPAAMSQHVQRMVRHLAVEVDATPEQESKLAAIAKSAADDLLPLRKQGRDIRKQAVALLAAPTVDRAAIEQFRTQQLQLVDTATKRLTQALADAAEVLTPEQRQALAERFARMHGRRHGGWDGPQDEQHGPSDQPDQPE